VTQSAGKRVLFVGSGDLAVRTAAALGRDWQAIGLCRHPARLANGLRGIAGDYSAPGGFSALPEWAPDVIVLTLKPLAMDAPGYRAGFLAPMRALLQSLGGRRPQRILHVSSTRVYTESDGGWVSETSPVANDDSPAGMLAASETALLESGQAGCVLRCAGLYGAPDGMLTARVARGELSPAQDPPQYSNRIHRDDVAGFLAYLISGLPDGRQPEACYNLVDNEPAAQHEVERWLARAMGVAATRTRAPSGGRANKRVSNTRLRESGYRLRYPDYRTGYAAALGLSRAGEAEVDRPC
jgi:uncharacterized protein YbjT (DUF2867 family)